MSSKPKPTAPNASGEGAWTEERLEQALNRLKLLHIKARDLRTTIPRMCEPLVKPNNNPRDLYLSFTKSIDGARQEVKEFQDLMKAEESKKIFDRAKQSRQANPLGIKTWNPTEHPDWMDIEP